MTRCDPPWTWPRPQVMRAVHEEHLAEHGGLSGVRDEDVFRASLGRSEALGMAGPSDVAAVAAAYGAGLARSRPFLDGNRRSAFLAVELFLALNGWRLAADDAQCALAMLCLDDGHLDEQEFAQWLRQHLQARDA